MLRTIDFEHGVTAIDAHYHRPGLAAFYLLIEGGRAAFIDTGTQRVLIDAGGDGDRKLADS